MQEKQNKKLIHYFPYAGRCSNILHINNTTLSAPLLIILPPGLCTEDDATHFGISLGSSASSVPVLSPLNFLYTLSLFAGGVEGETEKVLKLCKPCSAAAKASLNY